MLTASDAQLVDGMRFFAERMKLVVEPTGCLGFAAAREMAAQLRGKRIGVLDQRRQRRPGALRRAARGLRLRLSLYLGATPKRQSTFFSSLPKFGSLPITQAAPTAPAWNTRPPCGRSQ